MHQNRHTLGAIVVAAPDLERKEIARSETRAVSERRQTFSLNPDDVYYFWLTLSLKVGGLFRQGREGSEALAIVGKATCKLS